MDRGAEKAVEEHLVREKTSHVSRRRRSSRESAPRAVTLSGRFLFVAVLATGMALGALHWWTLVPCAFLALIAGLFAFKDVAISRAGYVPVLGFLLLATYTAFQAVPLPFAWAHALSDANATVWATALSPLHESAPRWAPLSVDPGASLVEALRWAAYGCLMGAAILAGARRGLSWGAHALFFSAFVIGSTTLIHGIFGMHEVYGVYVPTFSPSRWRVGPLLNANNVAGYMNLGMFSGLGAMLSRRPRVPRRLLGFGVAMLLPLVVLSGSRAGLASFVCGLVTFAALLRENVSKARLSWKVLAPASFAVLGAGFLAWLGVTREVSRELFATNTEKLEMFPHVVRLIGDHPMFGIGRGAFESAFPAYHVPPGNAIFAHAENFPLQWLAEWGIPVGGIALGALAWVLRVGLRGLEGSASGAGIFSGLVALVLQNLLDLAFEVPGAFAAAVLAVGVLWGHAHRRELAASTGDPGTSAESGASWIGAARIGTTVVMLALGALVIGFGRHPVAADRLTVKNLFNDVDYEDAAVVAAIRDQISQAIRRHPAEPYFPRIGAIIARRVRDENPVPWIQNALVRGPQIGETHFALAIILGSHGVREQALLELRLASEYDPGRLARPAAQITILLARDFEDIGRAAPEGAPGRQIYSYAAELLPGPSWEPIKLRCLEAAITKDPEFAGSRSTYATALIEAMTAGGTDGSCAGEHFAACVTVFQDQLSALAKLEPDAPTVVVLKARFLVATGHVWDAEGLLRQWCPRYIGAAASSCERAHVEAAAATRSVEAFRGAARSLAALPCGGRGCSPVLSFLGATAENMGALGDALAYYQKATEETPTDEKFAKIAQLATELGEPGLAAAALRRVARGHPEDPDVQRRLNEAKLRAMVRTPMH